MAESSPALLPEQGWGEQVAATLPAPDAARSGSRKGARRLRRAGGVCFRSCGDAGRDRSRSARRGPAAGHSAVRDERGVERFSKVYFGVGRVGGGSAERESPW